MKYKLFEEYIEEENETFIWFKEEVIPIGVALNKSNWPLFYFIDYFESQLYSCHISDIEGYKKLILNQHSTKDLISAYEGDSSISSQDCDGIEDYQNEFPKWNDIPLDKIDDVVDIIVNCWINSEDVVLGRFTSTTDDKEYYIFSKDKFDFREDGITSIIDPLAFNLIGYFMLPYEASFLQEICKKDKISETRDIFKDLSDNFFWDNQHIIVQNMINIDLAFAGDDLGIVQQNITEIQDLYYNNVSNENLNKRFQWLKENNLNTYNRIKKHLGNNQELVKRAVSNNITLPGVNKDIASDALKHNDSGLF